MNLVIVVIEFHDASLEWVFLMRALFLLGLACRHQNALLKEVCRYNDRVGVQLAVVLDLLDSL